MKLGRLVTLAAVAIAAFAVAPASAAPANDSFASAQAVSVPGVYPGSIVGAGIEPEEHLGCAHASTVWFRFTVEYPTPVAVHVRQAVWTFDPWVEVFGGDLPSPPGSRRCEIGGPVGLVAEPGTTYYVQVGTRGGLAGEFKLSLGIGTIALSLAGGYAYTDGSGVDMAAYVYPLVAGVGVHTRYRPAEGGGRATACLFVYLAAFCQSGVLPPPPDP